MAAAFDVKDAARECVALAALLEAGIPSAKEARRLASQLGRRHCADDDARPVVHQHWRDVWFTIEAVVRHHEEGEPFDPGESLRFLWSSLSRLRRRLAA